MGIQGIRDTHVLITGGSRGIGAAAARAFGQAGAHVSVLGRTTADLERVADSVRESDRQAAAVHCDVTDPGSIRNAVDEATEQLGPVDVLVNNAGIAPSAPVAKTDDDTWNQVLRVNLHGAWWMTRALLPGMLERETGRVVNVASVAGKTGFLYTAAYCSSKAGLIGMTRALAHEVATKGITVNAVCPGWVETDMVSDAVSNIADKTRLTEEQARARLAAMSPQNRMMTANEVASLIVYLASDAARGINGQAINVDGGDMPV